MNAKNDIGIVGAGLMGRLLAWQLLQRGKHVTLFDKDTTEGEESCAYTAAGMLAPHAELEKAEEDIARMGEISMKRWPDILNSLDCVDALHTQGSILLAYPQDKSELERCVSLIHKKHSDSYAEKLDETSLNTLEPEIHSNLHAYYLPTEAWINNQRLLTALTEKLTAHENLTWKVNIEIHPKDLLDKFNTVIDCRGYGAKDDLKDLRGVRGEVIWLHAPKVNITRPVRIMHPRYRIYLVPRENNHYVLGASEIESEDFSPISVQSCLELLSAVYNLHSGFAEARIEKTLVNCRPAFPDNLPRITQEGNLISVNGLFRHGYLLGPYLLAEVEGLIA